MIGFVKHQWWLLRVSVHMVWFDLRMRWVFWKLNRRFKELEKWINKC